MLKACFIGSKNSFNEMLVHWLSQRTHLVGVVWTTSAKWQKTWKGRIRFLRKRLQRRGLGKTIDEILFYCYYHIFLHSRSLHKLQEDVLKPYTLRCGSPRWAGDSVPADNVNSHDVLAFLRQHQPDLAFAVCVNDYFKKEVRGIPRLGVFLWHEGLTPEYKGLYSPFWAIYNLDFQHLGYTLLQMNDKYDEGPIFVQGPARDVDPFRDTHCYVGHKAIADSLPLVEEFLRRLERGTARPIVRPHTASRYYTYPGMSDYLRQQLRLRRTPRALRAQEHLEAQVVDSVAQPHE